MKINTEGAGVEKSPPSCGPACSPASPPLRDISNVQRRGLACTHSVTASRTHEQISPHSERPGPRGHAAAGPRDAVWTEPLTALPKALPHPLSPQALSIPLWQKELQDPHPPPGEGTEEVKGPAQGPAACGGGDWEPGCHTLPPLCHPASLCSQSPLCHKTEHPRYQVGSAGGGRGQSRALGEDFIKGKGGRSRNERGGLHQATTLLHGDGPISNAKGPPTEGEETCANNL